MYVLLHVCIWMDVDSLTDDNHRLLRARIADPLVPYTQQGDTLYVCSLYYIWRSVVYL